MSAYRLHDYDDDELLELTEEQRARLIEVECANRGLPLAPKQPVAPVKPEAQPDLQCFRLDVPTLYFKDKEAALAVASFLGLQPVFDTRGLGRTTWAAPYTLVPVDDRVYDVRAERHWTSEHYAAHAHVLNKYTDDKAEYDRLKKEFDEDTRKRSDVINELAERLSQIRERKDMEAAIVMRFAEYVDLAGGDQQVALRFLLKANTRWDESFVRNVLASIIHDEQGVPEHVHTEEAEARGNAAGEDGSDDDLAAC